jgi:hypothetical protein
MPGPVGERCFRFKVPASGEVQLRGPALLGRVAPHDFQAQLADGTPLCRDPKGLNFGFWAVKNEGDHLTFLVGTRAEFEAIRRAELQESGSTPGRPSGGSSSGGRRGGKGNVAPSDPSSSTGP